MSLKKSMGYIRGEVRKYGYNLPFSLKRGKKGR
jgi:hypothetical protein